MLAPMSLAVLFLGYVAPATAVTQPPYSVVDRSDDEQTVRLDAEEGADQTTMVALPTVSTTAEYCWEPMTITLLLVLGILFAPALLSRHLSSVANWRGSIDLDTSHSLVVMAFNNQNGYDTAGNFNGDCFATTVKRHQADVVAVGEGDAMHFQTANRDALEYTSAALGSPWVKNTDFGPPGYADTVGVGMLSTRHVNAPPEYIQLPRPSVDPDGIALNRFLVVNRFKVNDVIVTVGAVHLEWFGDPSAQTAAIADYFRTQVRGPAIIVGDFNIEPNGGNKAAPHARAWDPLLADGWISTTPIGASACSNNVTESAGADGAEQREMDETEEKEQVVGFGHLCKSASTTAMVTKGCNYPCWGYQLDWILYRQAVSLNGNAMTARI